MNCCEVLLLERSALQDVNHTVYVFEGFQLDVTRRKLISSGGLVLPLNTRAMEALLLLVANAGQLVEKRRLMETVWPTAIVEDNNLNQCILAIRKALGETAGSNRYIMTVPGRGYRFVCPVHAAMQESPTEPLAGSGVRSRVPAALWVGFIVVVWIVAILLMHARPGMSSTTGMESALPVTQPELLLRLRAAAPGDSAAQSMPVNELAGCLARRPDMKLRVLVQLVPDTAAAPVWSGQYMAEAQNLPMQAAHNSDGPGCGAVVMASDGHDQAPSSQRAQ